jgi:adenylate cyclase class 2
MYIGANAPGIRGNAPEERGKKMATEIEVKAWVDDMRAVKKRLATLGTELYLYDKRDTYWYNDSFTAAFPSGSRIRRELRTIEGAERSATETFFVTYKAKEVRGNIEVNDEREFRVSDAAVFEELLRRAAFQPRQTKRKQGVYFRVDGINVELVEVEGLGWFLELEILADNESPETVQAARERLLTLLDKAEVPRARIETRYYTEMLGSKV